MTTITKEKLREFVREFVRTAVEKRVDDLRDGEDSVGESLLEDLGMMGNDDDELADAPDEEDLAEAIRHEADEIATELMRLFGDE